MRKRTAARRALDFETLDRVMPDVDRLMERGYRSVGNWTLGQVCNHLAKSLAASVDGYPDVEAPWLAPQDGRADLPEADAEDRRSCPKGSRGLSF